MMTTSATITAVFVASLATLTACGDETMDPTMTAAQAKAQAAEHVREATTASLPTGFQLIDRGSLPLGCTDTQGKPDGRTEIAVDYWIDGIDRAKNDDYVDAVKNWWTAHGWNIESDSRPRDMFVNAKNSHTEFTMSIKATPDGRLSIDASSPCVWPNGTPQPKA
ncbi:hypothetical protein AB5J62_16290 [Amycolatopsis sp. cg5]|uniref:hypothetical protein n=1 Tax=Amycolatopsis sp. cg5 TaxID=3238802 RepID=UPI003524D175